MTEDRRIPDLAGFGAADLEAALAGDFPIARERVEVHALFTAKSGDLANGGVWIVLDFMDFDLSVINAIKRKIAERTALKIDRIHVLTTHNHGAGDPEHPDKIAEFAADAARQALDKVRPALIRGVQVAMPEGINYRRRIYVPEFGGAWTTFAGPNRTDRRSASGFIEGAIHNIANGEASYFGWEPSDRPAPDYEPGDPDFFLMEFQDAETGEMLGSITRFAMHAIMRAKPGLYFSSDFPWHIRQLAETKIGGSALFFNGPCADIAPCYPWPDKTSRIEEQYASAMLEAGLAAIEAEAFEPLTTFHTKKLVPLPVRQEVLENRVEIDGAMPPMSDLPARKRYLERVRLAETLEFLEGKYRNGEYSVGTETVVELGALRLGKWLIVGYPGETFSSTARRAADCFPETRIVSVTEHGRTAMYMAPEAEYLLGGYEAACAVTSCKAEDKLFHAAKSLIQESLIQAKRPAESTPEDLLADLHAMGIAPDDTLLIHSSYKSIGKVTGGPDAVLDMLMKFLGKKGLLVFPAFSYNDVNEAHPVFDVRSTPTSVGILAERFRQRPGVVRSLHPTHSVAAFGPDAEAFIAGHEKAQTPCPAGSPLWKLIGRQGKILFIGTGLEHNTFCHGVDEWLAIPDLRRKEAQHLTMIDACGNRSFMELHRHCVARNAFYAELETVFARSGALKQGHFGHAECYLLDCRKAAEALGVKI